MASLTHLDMDRVAWSVSLAGADRWPALTQERGRQFLRDNGVDPVVVPMIGGNWIFLVNNEGRLTLRTWVHDRSPGGRPGLCREFPCCSCCVREVEVPVSTPVPGMPGAIWRAWYLEEMVEVTGDPRSDPPHAGTSHP